MRTAKESRQLTVTLVGPVIRTRKGNCYVECETEHGTVAFWGKTGSMANITTVQSQVSPFRIQCQCVQSNWVKHIFWIPESSKISVIAETSSTGTDEELIVTIDELSRWRRAIIRILDQLSVPRDAQAGLGSRIGHASRNESIPREIAAMMRLIAEMRNVAEYESKTLSDSESEAVKNAWRTISEWARVRLPVTE